MFWRWTKVLRRFGTTWAWVINDRMFIFGWTVPLRTFRYLYWETRQQCLTLKLRLPEVLVCVCSDVIERRSAVMSVLCVCGAGGEQRESGGAVWGTDQTGHRQPEPLDLPENRPPPTCSASAKSWARSTSHNHGRYAGKFLNPRRVAWSEKLQHQHKWREKHSLLEARMCAECFNRHLINICCSEGPGVHLSGVFCRFDNESVSFWKGYDNVDGITFHFMHSFIRCAVMCE